MNKKNWKKSLVLLSVPAVESTHLTYRFVLIAAQKKDQRKIFAIYKPFFFLPTHSHPFWLKAQCFIVLFNSFLFFLFLFQNHILTVILHWSLHIAQNWSCCLCFCHIRFTLKIFYSSIYLDFLTYCQFFPYHTRQLIDPNFNLVSNKAN